MGNRIADERITDMVPVPAVVGSHLTLSGPRAGFFYKKIDLRRDTGAGLFYKHMLVS